MERTTVREEPMAAAFYCTPHTTARELRISVIRGSGTARGPIPAPFTRKSPDPNSTTNRKVRTRPYPY